MSAPILIFVMCLVQVLGLLGLGTFAALLPVFLSEWAISNTEAGWLSGLFFAGYMVAVPVLVSLTDRRDARGIFLAGSALSTAAGFAFAFLADGFWSAAVLRFALGVGFAGVYMPGMKALTDRVPTRSASRAVAFYTASFGIGGALSLFLAGTIEAAWGWRWAFTVAAAGPALATVIGFSVLRPRRPEPPNHGRRLLDFRHIFANRRVMAYVLAYGCHNWELFALSSWLVVFLTVAAGDAGSGWLSPINVAVVVTLLSLPASVGGNELSMRLGRRRTVVSLLLLSAVAGGVLGFTVELAYPLVVLLSLLYGATTAADSASITAGAVTNADADSQGATLAVHSVFGFAGGFLGPLVFGGVLDAAGGGSSTVAWGLAFCSAAAAAVVGSVIVTLLTRAAPRHPEGESL